MRDRPDEAQKLILKDQIFDKPLLRPKFASTFGLFAKRGDLGK